MNLASTLDLYAQRPLHGRLKWHGLDVSIENRKGSTRSGVDPNGKKWSVVMKNDYGYLRRTTGSDGDAVDAFMGPDASAKMVYVVHTKKSPDFVKYDEDKCLLNFPSASDAKKAFLANYDRPEHFGSMSTFAVDDFIQKALATKDKPMKLAASALYGMGTLNF
jgi:hypothetical protein